MGALIRGAVKECKKIFFLFIWLVFSISLFLTDCFSLVRKFLEFMHNLDLVFVGLAIVSIIVLIKMNS